MSITGGSEGKAIDLPFAKKITIERTPSNLHHYGLNRQTYN
jgi:hypothetical protein